ncbi:MAG: hypothetical protein ACLFP2_03100 [Candidatus Woesearchaeota archaeon]
MDSLALIQEGRKKIRPEDVERHEYSWTIFKAFEKYTQFFNGIKTKIYNAKKADNRLYDDCELLEREELSPSSRIDTILEESSSEKFWPRMENLKEQVNILEQIVKHSSEVFNNLEYYPPWVWGLEQEIISAYSDNHKLASEKGALEKAIKKLESDNSLLEQRVRLYETDLQELQGRFEQTAAYLKEVVHQKDSWRNQYQDIQKQLREKETDYQDLTERIADFESTFRELERTGKKPKDIPGYISTLESELKAQKAEYKTLKSQNKKLAAMLKKAKDTVPEDIGRRIEQQQAAFRDLQEAYEQQNASYMELERLSQTQQQKLDELYPIIENLPGDQVHHATKLKQYKDWAEELKSINSQLDEQLKTEKDMHETLKVNYRNLESRFESTRRELAKVSRDYQSIKRENEKFSRDLNKKKERIDSLESQVKAYKPGLMSRIKDKSKRIFSREKPSQEIEQPIYAPEPEWIPMRKAIELYGSPCTLDPY